VLILFFRWFWFICGFSCFGWFLVVLGGFDVVVVFLEGGCFGCLGSFGVWVIWVVCVISVDFVVSVVLLDFVVWEVLVLLCGFS
jgi:hypothetical protein